MIEKVKISCSVQLSIINNLWSGLWKNELCFEKFEIYILFFLIFTVNHYTTRNRNFKNWHFWFICIYYFKLIKKVFNYGAIMKANWWEYHGVRSFIFFLAVLLNLGWWHWSLMTEWQDRMINMSLKIRKIPFLFRFK